MPVRLEFQLRADTSMSPIELAGFEPSQLLADDLPTLERRPAQIGRNTRELAELFRITRTADDRKLTDNLVIVSGSQTQRLVMIGHQMRIGRLRVEGDVGPHVGHAMSGGELRVAGNAGVYAGAQLSGGFLQIGGHADDFLGAATPGTAHGMTGGLIVAGNAAAHVGLQMRRGTIVVMDSVGPEAGTRMIAGTVLVGGQLGQHPGMDNRRGSIICMSPQPDLRLPLTYRRSGQVMPAHLPLVFGWLARHQIPLEPARFRLRPMVRYLGDGLAVGKGELLIPC